MHGCVTLRALKQELLEVPGCAERVEALRCLKNQIARRIGRTLTRAHAEVPESTPTPLNPTPMTCVAQAA